MIREATEKIVRNENLSLNQMEEVMEEMMTGRIETPDIVSFLVALNKKGESIDEITAAARVMRRHAIKVKTKHKLILDTCGTGADNSGTFNVSTVTAFVVSGCGVAVAKHGNRSVSSCCGSADILEALGIDINLPKDKIEKCLDEIGIAFLFAPNFHPAMKYAMPARKEIRQKTIFNILGPLTNPAGATHQLLGVYDRRWIRILAEVLGNLGSRQALVVNSEDGLDEVTTTAKTFIAEFKLGKIKEYEITPEDFGFQRAALEDLKGGDVHCNARILMDILKGKIGLKRDMVILNSAAGLYVADKVNSIREGISLAASSIDSGSALKKLELLKEYSNK
ncbi:MAG: anthranilate phosphoribosyltransferase [Candidatus Omnitrophica bacterium]|nr:anthranilate phosphoribosyltransferase [Candidatus Omnitrophota bacterium]